MTNSCPTANMISQLYGNEANGLIISPLSEQQKKLIYQHGDLYNPCMQTPVCAWTNHTNAAAAVTSSFQLPFEPSMNSECPMLVYNTVPPLSTVSDTPASIHTIPYHYAVNAVQIANATQTVNTPMNTPPDLYQPVHDKDEYNPEEYAMHREPHNEKRVKKHCPYWSKGVCYFGKQCKFLHDDAMRPKTMPSFEECHIFHKYGAPPKKKCKFFEQGKCEKGNMCTFLHQTGSPIHDSPYYSAPSTCDSIELPNNHDLRDKNEEQHVQDTQSNDTVQRFHPYSSSSLLCNQTSLVALNDGQWKMIGSKYRFIDENNEISVKSSVKYQSTNLDKKVVIDLKWRAKNDSELYHVTFSLYEMLPNAKYACLVKGTCKDQFAYNTVPSVHDLIHVAHEQLSKHCA